MHDRIIFATDKGIYQYHNNRFSHLGKVDENIIELFKKDGKNAWAFSDHHIFKINFEQNNLTLSEFKVDLGRSNSVILSIVEFNSKLWVATKNGVFITDLKTEKYKTESSFFKFKLDSILSKENSIPWDKKLTIYSEDKIQLFFRTISFDRKLKRDLEYSIDGKNWLETNKNSLTLTDLTFGENTLLIRRIDDPKQIIFRMQILVVKHYYETLWFKLVMFIVCSLVITWLVVKVINRREKKKIKELAVLNLELKLLTSKMNPHFTFNTINSIQHFILKNDKKEAIQYLSDFALLMRKNLDFSMKERITLEQEKEFLELYVQLENKRFDSNFILECKIETSEISMTTKIPSMLIQPLVENVIIHANYEITEEKKIIISIRLTNGYFIIKVIDFGEGMKTIKEHDNHKSYGLEIIKSRIKLYNGNAYSEEDLMIEPTNKVTKIGTTVIIKLKEWTQ